ncbi:THUMP-like domain-containing protein [Corynebacterium bovis]|uniref:class I SAM-dependent methyltransferase n=1 Tax=Corynebacterium bovis TaxID=36808 RepID=UPI000F64EFFD|nr:SAM-dependent methyltransferase [Corynebacterium bovis]RRO82637.1 SAM-dependent methyltransferase [Corynebacterium bovis]RRO83474.1 SAM-dependent methyltransferase [Corynebacterium bovis]
MSYTHEALDWLIGHPEAVAAAEELPLTRRTSVADVASLRARFGDHARALAELVTARRGAVSKVPAGWLVCSESAQQATPAAVAAVRARYLADQGVDAVVDVTCSVGTELAALRGRVADVVGADLDGVRLRMAARNVPGVPLVRADALDAVVTAGVVVADPARRGARGRITDPAALMPPLPDLLAAYAGREMAVKCAPGIDYTDWEGQVDIVSVDGEVKEACLYTPGLGVPGRRRAVVVRRGGGGGPGAGDGSGPGDAGVADGVTTLHSGMPETDGEASPVGEVIVDPDGAVVRAGLVRHYAARHGLRQLDPRIAYLTGETVPPGVRGFRVLEQVPLKKLRPALAAAGCGSVEILVRGVDVDPDVLRRKLRLTGDRALSVVVTRIDRSPVAFVCEAVRG